MEVLKVYRLEVWDGGDRCNPTGFYLSKEEDAKAWKEKNKFDDYTEIKLRVCDSLQDLENSSIQKLKEQALSKLSTEERDALGY